MQRVPSLPSWERGLKYSTDLVFFFQIVSLPSWERGLKFLPFYEIVLLCTSLPSWERGLKFDKIERCSFNGRVAPLVGARIEIVIAVFTSGGTWSLPSWERGLK